MNPNMYCTNCGTVAEPKKHTPGTFLTEAVLWLFLIIPGLIYSVWRIDFDNVKRTHQTGF